MSWKRLTYLWIGLCFGFSLSAQQMFTEQELFINGEDGYACYRIPAIIKSKSGTLLAFAEGRVEGCSDFGDVDIVMRSSADNGITWSDQKIVANNGEVQVGNPAPVLDVYDPRYRDGRIFLFYNTGIASEHATRKGEGLREIWYVTSIDDGFTWSEPTNITTQVHHPNRPDLNKSYVSEKDWRSYANTPGHALQLRTGKYAGRIIIPANHSEGSPQTGFNDYRAHAFYTDDFGKTFNLSPNIDIPSSNESIAVELSDGRVMQNIRHQNGKSRSRIVGISSTGAESWDESYFDTTLISPVCQASIIDYTLSNKRRVILFTNPASKTKRENLTIRVSFDDGESWPVSRTIRKGESAYSDIVITEENDIGVLYEHGNDEGIHFSRFNEQWLFGSENYVDKPWVRKLLWPNHVQSKDVKLSPPIARYDSGLFEQSTSLNFATGYPNSIVRYTTNGMAPSEKSEVFQSTLTIDRSQRIRAATFHSDFKRSDIVDINFVQASRAKDIKNVWLYMRPNERYKGKNDVLQLFDLQKGTMNFQGDSWMGFDTSQVRLALEFDEPRDVSSVTLSALSDHGSWIFLPKTIEITTDKGVEIKSWKVPAKEQSKSLEYLNIEVEHSSISKMEIKIIHHDALPEWHQGAGSKPWLFIDEIIIE